MVVGIIFSDCYYHYYAMPFMLHAIWEKKIKDINILPIIIIVLYNYSIYILWFKNCLGWSAAVANMLDTVEKFKFKADLFEIDFKRYLDGREHSISLLQKYVMRLNKCIYCFSSSFLGGWS